MKNDSSFKRIISVHSAPRSGSTWLAQIFNSHPDVRYKYQPLKSQSFGGAIHQYSSKLEMERFFEEVYHYEDDYLDQNFQKKRGEVPDYFKKNPQPPNLVLKMVRYHYLLPLWLKYFEDIKIIGLIRHPCGFLNSWKNAPKEFLPHWNFDEEWYFAQSYNQFQPGEYYGFNRWREIAKMFQVLQKVYPQNFKLIRYEQLIEKTEELVEEVLRFCDLNYSEQVANFVEKTRAVQYKSDYSVFKGGKDPYDWKKTMDKKIINRVNLELSGTQLETFLSEING